MTKPTHREVKSPSITARFLADFMAAGSRERARRTIIQGCKYRSTARVIQHNEAKAIIINFVTSVNPKIEDLIAKSAWIKAKLADDPFEEDVNKHNGDYVARFAEIFPNIVMPDAVLSHAPEMPTLTLAGVKISVEMQFRLRRVTRTNKIRLGGAMLRYAKGKPLSLAAGEWQSAYLFGYLGVIQLEAEAAAEQKLCITIDAQSGNVIPAPSNSIDRFKEMEAACATIAERWPNVDPPTGAILP